MNQRCILNDRSEMLCALLRFGKLNFFFVFSFYPLRFFSFVCWFLHARYSVPEREFSNIFRYLKRLNDENVFNNFGHAFLLWFLFVSNYFLITEFQSKKKILLLKTKSFLPFCCDNYLTSNFPLLSSLVYFSYPSYKFVIKK